MPPEQADGLRAAAQRKREDALKRAGDALRELEARGEQINFERVAQAAGVSRQWLYKQPGLRAEIERLRARQQPSKRLPSAERASNMSLSRRVETLLEDNRRLRRENAELRHELALARGRTPVAAAGRS